VMSLEVAFGEPDGVRVDHDLDDGVAGPVMLPPTPVTGGACRLVLPGRSR
jgi:hypothetical protein